MVLKNNTYCIDFEDFENKIVKNNIKLFLFCSPHNPAGRVWTVEELQTIGDICLKHNVIVVSDEIHQDFVFCGKHTIFASLGEKYQQNCIICTSSSKTFNLASMLISNIFIPNLELKRKFRKEVNSAGISQLSVLGLVATEAAYSMGEEWYRAMMTYIRQNLEFVRNFVNKNLPNVKMIDLEGTYLVWLDFRKMGISPEKLDEIIVHRAKLWLDSGKIFGKCGEGFQRINVACPRSVLKEALERLKNALINSDYNL